MYMRKAGKGCVGRVDRLTQNVGGPEETMVRDFTSFKGQRRPPEEERKERVRQTYDEVFPAPVDGGFSGESTFDRSNIVNDVD